MSFETALAYTLKYEGLYSNDEDDRGGETYRGIARRHWPEWMGWPIVDQDKNNLPALIRNPVLDEFVMQFYRDNFWRRCWCHAMPDALAHKVFDTAVNVGCRRAIRWLQKSLNDVLGAGLAEDGVMGAQTGSVMSMIPSEGVLMSYYRLQQVQHYHDIVDADRTQGKYLFGWLTRALV